MKLWCLVMVTTGFSNDNDRCIMLGILVTWNPAKGLGELGKLVILDHQPTQASSTSSWSSCFTVSHVEPTVADGSTDSLAMLRPWPGWCRRHSFSSAASKAGLWCFEGEIHAEIHRNAGNVTFIMVHPARSILEPKVLEITATKKHKYSRFLRHGQKLSSFGDGWYPFPCCDL